MTITEFLEACIVEEEEQARDWQGDWNYSLEAAGNRLIAWTAAKRKIIGFHLRDDDVQRMVYGDIYPCTECGDVDDSPVEWPCRTLRALAAVYKDHQDYQQEWAL